MSRNSTCAQSSCAQSSCASQLEELGEKQILIKMCGILTSVAETLKANRAVTPAQAVAARKASVLANAIEDASFKLTPSKKSLGKHRSKALKAVVKVLWREVWRCVHAPTIAIGCAIVTMHRAAAVRFPPHPPPSLVALALPPSCVHALLWQVAKRLPSVEDTQFCWQMRREDHTCECHPNSVHGAHEQHCGIRAPITRAGAEHCLPFVCTRILSQHGSRVLWVCMAPATGAWKGVLRDRGVDPIDQPLLAFQRCDRSRG